MKSRTLPLITNELAGIFWISSGEINQSSIYFDDLNYVFDGVISHYLAQKNNQQTDLFFTKQFNDQLFLLHLDDTKSFSSMVDDQLALLSPHLKDKSKILIIDESDKAHIEDLTFRYPGIQFVKAE